MRGVIYLTELANGQTAMIADAVCEHMGLILRHGHHISKIIASDAIPCLSQQVTVGPHACLAALELQATSLGDEALLLLLGIARKLHYSSVCASQSFCCSSLPASHHPPSPPYCQHEHLCRHAANWVRKTNLG